jgi:hypothetical protein
MASQPKSRPEVETLQRIRRVETRVTRLMIALGVDTGANKPELVEDKLLVPSIHCSLKEIVDSIPPDWHGPVRVFVGTEQVATIGR